MQLSAEHLRAVSRSRRIIDYPGFVVPYAVGTPTEWVDYQFSLINKPGVQVESTELRIQLSGVSGTDTVEVKLNGILLPNPTRSGEWRIFHSSPQQFAVGVNLVTLRMSDPDQVATVEKVEVHVAYKAVERYGVYPSPGLDAGEAGV